MAQIRINPQEIDSSASKFALTSSELRSLIYNTNYLVINLKSSFVGKKADIYYTKWESELPNLIHVLDTLESTNVLLKQLAASFQAADSDK
jgi:uncharacterized protein YukE